MVSAACYRTSRLGASWLVSGMLLACTVAPADALVRFGHGVFIGGHDFSHRTYGPRRRAVIYLSERRPARPGCLWHPDGHRGRIEVCHLQTVHRPRR